MILSESLTDRVRYESENSVLMEDSKYQIIYEETKNQCNMISPQSMFDSSIKSINKKKKYVNRVKHVSFILLQHRIKIDKHHLTKFL